jgi:hypothetical protein
MVLGRRSGWARVNGLQPCGIPPLSAPDTQPIAADFAKILVRRGARGLAHGAQGDSGRARLEIDHRRNVVGG